ncbi:MAG: Gfo/Idh/MocA family oxidoreductase [Armatimonadota bacterium]|nr:Gfo/Idh/MocA family oxidoreductase [Armatimonadota bacterium]
MLNRPITVAIVGAGHRSVAYARYALSHPDRMKVVAVADPNPLRRQSVAQTHGIPPENCFESYEELAARPPLADAVINGTMDGLHYASAKPLLEAGYHMLLEKPIAQKEEEVRSLIDTARRHGRTVMICHVLRYAPFYAQVKELLASGEIGDVVCVHTAENVSYHHMAVGFIRGRWRRRGESNPMLLAKCCHDLDIIAWIYSGVPATRVASFGSLKQFRPENAPPGSGTRCLVDCQIEAECPYSARANYITQGLWSFYAWEPIEHLGMGNATEEQKLESLRTDNPYGRCVWRCDNDVVDHQSVIVEFANGATASHDMFCATARPTRTLHIVGTRGEIEGDMEAGRLVVRHPWTERGKEYRETPIEIAVKGDGHGGGDSRLIADFVSVLRGEPTSRGATRIEDSLTGHLIAFAADRSMLEHRVVEVLP